MTRRWTYEQLSELTRMGRLGKSPERIAEAIGRSVESVRARLSYRNMSTKLDPKKKAFGKISAAERYRAAVRRQLQELAR